VAGVSMRNEIQLFDRDIIYKPSYTLCNFKRGIYTLDWGNKGNMIAFGGGDGKLQLINYGMSNEK